VEDERGDGLDRLLCALAGEERLPTSRRAPKEAAEPERKNLAVEPETGPLEGGSFDPDPEAEGEAERRSTCPEPEDETFARLLAGNERVAPSAPSDGEG
jgi:hypothetical protein